LKPDNCQPRVTSPLNKGTKNCNSSGVVLYETGFFSDPGQGDMINEDSLIVDTSAGLFAVADGLGGRPSGDLASRTAIDTFSKHLRDLPLHARLTDSSLEKAVTAANKAVRKLANVDPLNSGCGTTLSAIVFDGQNGRVVHIGDSRVYLYRKGRLCRLTEDHTLAGEMLREGQMSQTRFRKSSWRNMLSRSIGAQARVSPDILPFRFIPEDMLILATDGLTKCVSEDEMLRILKKVCGRGISCVCQELGRKAMNSSPRDNLTVLAVKLAKSS